MHFPLCPFSCQIYLVCIHEPPGTHEEPPDHILWTRHQDIHVQPFLHPQTSPCILPCISACTNPSTVQLVSECYVFRIKNTDHLNRIKFTMKFGQKSTEVPMRLDLLFKK